MKKKILTASALMMATLFLSACSHMPSVQENSITEAVSAISIPTVDNYTVKDETYISTSFQQQGL